MKLTKDQATDVVYGDDADWQQVPGTEQIVDQGRWSTTFSAVFQHKPTGKHYSLYWARGSTEQQEQSPFEYDDPDLYEVELREVTKKKWMLVGQ